jgi:thiamine pyrophosphokinase
MSSPSVFIATETPGVLVGGGELESGMLKDLQCWTDHHWAALSILSRHPGARVIVTGRDDVLSLTQSDMSFDLPIETRFSFYPLGDVQGHSVGSKWSIDGLSFTPLGCIGTSNTVSGPVRLWFGKPRMLVILPRSTWP